MLERWVTMKNNPSKAGHPLRRDIAIGSKFNRSRAGSIRLKLENALKKQSSSLQASVDSQMSLNIARIES